MCDLFQLFPPFHFISSHPPLHHYLDIAPDEVLPFQVERAYDALTNLTATHAVQSAFETLANIAHPLLLHGNFANGPASLRDLLVRESILMFTEMVVFTFFFFVCSTLHFPALIRTIRTRPTPPINSTLPSSVARLLLTPARAA